MFAAGCDHSPMALRSLKSSVLADLVWVVAPRIRPHRPFTATPLACSADPARRPPPADAPQEPPQQP